MIQHTNLVKLQILVVFLLILALPALKRSDCLAYQFTIGEELRYKVKWMHFRLGTVTIQVCDSLEMDSHKVYHAKFSIDSNPVLFFINMHSQFECYLDEHLRPHLYKSEEKVDGNKCSTYYRFDYNEKVVRVKIVDQKDSTKIINKSIPLDRQIFDGLSLIFYMRNNLLCPKEEKLNIIANGDTWLLDLKIMEKAKKIRLKAIDKDFVTHEIRGEAHFTSTAGISGRFRAWFAADDKKTPLIAELKVFIGHVKLILESWKNLDLETNEVAEL